MRPTARLRERWVGEPPAAQPQKRSGGALGTGASAAALRGLGFFFGPKTWFRFAASFRGLRTGHIRPRPSGVPLGRPDRRRLHAAGRRGALRGGRRRAIILLVRKEA